MTGPLLAIVPLGDLAVTATLVSGRNIGGGRVPLPGLGEVTGTAVAELYHGDIYGDSHAARRFDSTLTTVSTVAAECIAPFSTLVLPCPSIHPQPATPCLNHLRERSRARSSRSWESSEERTCTTYYDCPPKRVAHSLNTASLRHIHS